MGIESLYLYFPITNTEKELNNHSGSNDESKRKMGTKNKSKPSYKLSLTIP